MQINIDGHHVEVTDALRQYVKEKIGRLERHFDHVTNVHVVLKVERHVQKAECEMHASVVDKLDRQILKHKEKLKNHHRDGTPKRDQIAES